MNKTITLPGATSRMWPHGSVVIQALLLSLVASCGNQPPAFKEDQTQKSTGQGADATQQNGSSSGANSAAGGTAGSQSSEEVLPGMAQGAGSSGVDSMGTSGQGAGDKPGSGGAGSTSSSANGGGSGQGGSAPSSSGGSGNESGVGLTWRSVEVTQKAAGKVDILWIVDDSSSMTPEQNGLASNFNQLITQLAADGHDFQTAVTTTDVCQDTLPSDLSQRVCPVANYGGSAATHLRGSFVGDPGRKVLKAGDADLISRFTTYANRGVSGSGFEHGLYAARLAVEKVLNGQNEALLRSDAFLSVIVVSDEEDDGIGLGMVDAYNGHNFVADGLTTFRYTDDNLIGYLNSAKGAGKFAISSVVTTRNADGTLCSSPGVQPREEGTQYIKAATKTGGIIQSICDANWSSKLTQIGQDLNAQITQVTLPSHASATSVRVLVDGVTSTEWSYVTASNSVKFNAGHVPPPGAKIVVTYLEIP